MKDRQDEMRNEMTSANGNRVACLGVALAAMGAFALFQDLRVPPWLPVGLAFTLSGLALAVFGVVSQSRDSFYFHALRLHPVNPADPVIPSI